LIEGLEVRIENKNCENDAEEELRLLLGVTTNNEAKTIIGEYCDEQFALQAESSKHLKDYVKKPDYFVEEYFHGGTFWNEEVQYTDENGIDRNVLANDASRVNTVYNGRAQNGMILMPEYDGLNDCNNNAIYCCWSQDRQANDNNGTYVSFEIYSIIMRYYDSICYFYVKVLTSNFIHVYLYLCSTV